MNYFQCWSVRNILDLYVDGRLSLRAKHKIDSHLKKCPDCREEREVLSPVVSRTKTAVPKDLTQSILKKLEEKYSTSENAFPAAEILRLSPTQAAGLAYCLLVFSAHALVGGVSSQAYDAQAAQMLEAQR
jgi:anti-sigma factor RsiW